VKCHKARVQLQDYLDNQLPVKQQAKLERHLAACPDCRGELAFIKAYQVNLAVITPQAAPPDLLAEIRRQLSSTAPIPQKSFGKAFRLLPVFWPGLAGTALLAVVAVCLVRPWDFSLKEKVIVKAPVSQTVAPATAKGDKSAGTLRKCIRPPQKAETTVAREIAQKSVASAIPAADESVGTLRKSLRLPQKAEITAVQEGDQKAVASAVPTIDESQGTLRKSLRLPQKAVTPEEPVITVLIPAKKTSSAKSVCDESDAPGADDLVMRLKTLLKRIDGLIIREEEGDDRLKLPRQMSVAINPDSYPRLIAVLKKFGEVKEATLNTELFHDKLWFNLKIDYQAGEN
jgi:hypothetical protein